MNESYGALGRKHGLRWAQSLMVCVGVVWSFAAAAAPAGPGGQTQVFDAGPNNDTRWAFSVGDRLCTTAPCFIGQLTPEGGNSVQQDGLVQVGGAYFPKQLSGATFGAGINGPTFLMGPASMSGLNVSLQYKFFSERRLQRTLVILNNPSMSSITTNVDYFTYLHGGISAVRGSSSGDTLATIVDRWIVTSDSATNPPNRPVVTSVLFGPGTVTSSPNTVTVNTNLVYHRTPVTVPAGQTRALMFFTGLDNLVGGIGGGTNEAAVNSAALFDDSDAFEMEGLLTDFAGLEPQAVLNWALESIDITPDPFNVKDKADVTPDTIINAISIIVTGINAPAPVTVSGAPISEFLTNTDPTWRTTGFVNNDEPLRVRHRSAAAPNTVATTTLCIGPKYAPVCDTYNTTTADGADTTPNAFSFPPKTELELGVQVISQAVGITGFAADSPATINVGEFQIGGGPWITAGMVPPNSNIRIRHTTSSNSLGTVTSTLTVGGVSGSFVSKTGDAVPNVFTFIAHRNQPASTLVESAPVTIKGLTLSAPARVSGGEVRVGNGAWSAGPVMVENNSVVRVRHTTAATDLTDTTTTLCVGPVSQEVCRPYVSTTQDTTDFTPDAFGWPTKTNVAQSTLTNSTFSAISGFFGSLTLTIDVGEFRVSGGNWTTSASITSGTNVQVRHTSAASCSGSTTSTLTAGGVSGTFTTATAACAPPIP